MSRRPISQSASRYSNYGATQTDNDTEALIPHNSSSREPLFLINDSELGDCNDFHGQDEVFLRSIENGQGRDSHRKHSQTDVERDDDSMGGNISLSSRVKDCCRSCCTVQNVLNKFPIVKWIPKYRVDTFATDLVAGMTVGLTVIPQGLAYATIANLPPQYGLYSAFMGCFIYTFMGTSKDITLGPTAIMSLMTATFGASPIEGDVTFAIVLTLISGLVQLTMGILKLGILVNYISYPVINAFTSAAAITIACGQIKNILGLHDISREFMHMIYETCEKIPETRVWDLTMGLVSLVAVILLKKLRQIKWKDEDDPDVHVAIPILVMRKFLWLCGTGANAIIVITAAGFVAILDSYGIDDAITITGNITAGLPPFDVPKFSVTSGNSTVSTSELFSTIGTGLFIVPLLGLVETMAIGKAFARTNNYRIDPTQELLAIGTANIVSSFVSSYPITGSFSRTAVNSQCGVRTPLSGVWTGALVILALCLLTPWFYYIPKSALAAVIIAAVIQMVDYKILGVLWKANKWDLVPLVITFITSLTVGIEYGILIGIGVSLLMLLYPIARPKVKFSFYSGIVVMTPMQGINFPAAEHLEVKVMDEAEDCEKPKCIIISLEHVTDMDYTTIQSMRSLQGDCERKGMQLILVNAEPCVKRQIKNANIKNVANFPTLKDALEDLNIQDAKLCGREEELPFMNQL